MESDLKKEGNIYWRWKGEGYWSFDILDKYKSKICEIGWHHDKNKWVLTEFSDEGCGADIDKTQLKNILKLFSKVKKIGY